MAVQGSPLSRGLPFFVLMSAGTFVLSMFVQTRYDFVVRVQAVILSETTMLRCSTGTTVLLQDRNKSFTTAGKLNADKVDLVTELKVCSIIMLVVYERSCCSTGTKCRKSRKKPEHIVITTWFLCPSADDRVSS
jgi:hypothetical protein